jgi:hypothetical protein
MSQGLDARSFEARFHELMSAFGTRRDNEGCVQCVGCAACTRCTFCRESERLVRSHYCVRCRDCMDCSHCRDSVELIGCHHSIDSERCTASSYLVRCVGLSRSSYCFGCVGLSGKDFHVLNEPYSRQEYFALTRRLGRELRSGT